MKCPYCGEEMLSGFIQCRDGVYWTEKKRPVAAIPLGGGDSVNLNEEKGDLCPDYTKAWRCKECRKIIIEY